MLEFESIKTALNARFGGLENSECFDHALILQNDFEIAGSCHLACVTRSQNAGKWRVKSFHLEETIFEGGLFEVFSKLEKLVWDARQGEAGHGHAVFDPRVIT
ncbi:MAG: hypothetical protein JXQ79_01510 [Rhodobacteraceae bacterium]|nr:hypothetical protein [Paracoccaceae bacterium]